MSVFAVLGFIAVVAIGLYVVFQGIMVGIAARLFGSPTAFAAAIVVVILGCVILFMAWKFSPFEISVKPSVASLSQKQFLSFPDSQQYQYYC